MLTAECYCRYLRLLLFKDSPRGLRPRCGLVRDSLFARPHPAALCVAAWLCAFAALPLNAQERPDAPRGPVELLWPGGAAGAVGQEEADKPSLERFAPPPGKANGAAVVFCPGGGYGHLSIERESPGVTPWLNAQGVTVFILRYRLGPRYHHPAPMLDVQRAVRMVRARAAEWKIDPHRIGVLGISAGGHVASTAGTHFDSGSPSSPDHIERESCRPDFLILCCPVTTFTKPHRHEGSLRRLLGDKPDAALVENLSNEKQVTPQTPPTFLYHTNADTTVPPENSVLFYLALRKAKVPAELHIYEPGKHGGGLTDEDPTLITWRQRCADWLGVRGILPATATQPASPN